MSPGKPRKARASGRPDPGKLGSRLSRSVPLAPILARKQLAYPLPRFCRPVGISAPDRADKLRRDRAQPLLLSLVVFGCRSSRLELLAYDALEQLRNAHAFPACRCLELALEVARQAPAVDFALHALRSSASAPEGKLT